jgi:hypothetical protein
VSKPQSPAEDADALIARLQLQPHPEGGWYRRLYRAELTVACDTRLRPALTTILYLLRDGDTSRWHRVASEEAWHFFGGAPLRLHRLAPDLGRHEVRTTGPVQDGHLPVHVVPAHGWQAARSTGGYSLVGCTVAPGFEFEDFELMVQRPAVAAELRRRDPELARWI